jgi:preprotein translocase subunit Sec61beta
MPISFYKEKMNAALDIHPITRVFCSIAVGLLLRIDGLLRAKD